MVYEGKQRCLWRSAQGTPPNRSMVDKYGENLSFGRYYKLQLPGDKSLPNGCLPAKLTLVICPRNAACKEYAELNVVVSQNGVPEYAPQDIIFLIIGILKKVP